MRMQNIDDDATLKSMFTFRVNFLFAERRKYFSLLKISGLVLLFLATQ
jgi:hypothetical protein